MAPKRLEKEKLQTRINNSEDVQTKEAVFIQDPKKRRRCPLCNQNMNLYYLNFEDMFLMCENNLCDFPFGYEALQIVRDESELQEQPEKASKDFFEYPTVGEREIPASLDSLLGSSSCVSESDRLSTVSTLSDVDYFQLDKQETLATKLSKQNTERRKQKEIDKDLEKDLKHTKELTAKMKQLDSEPEVILKLNKNKSWLKNLKVWEVVTGRKLINKVKFNGNQQESQQRELEIAINHSDVNGKNPVVNIQIINKFHNEKTQNIPDNEMDKDQGIKAVDNNGHGNTQTDDCEMR